MSQPAPLILLVGMHRSGTSLLGSLLPQLGVPLPGELIDGDQHNPEGYYERADITALQEQLLIDLGHWWPSQAGVEPLPQPWLQHPASRRCAAQLQALLRTEMQRQAGPWAIKDPRTSLLLPLWREVAASLGLPLRLVLSVRDPAEVMVSLQQRDQSAAGMTAWRAQQLWWRHNSQVLRDGVGLPLQVLHYSRWFQQPVPQLEALAQFCLGEPPAASVQRQALHCIRPEHRRSRRRLLQRRPIHPKLKALEHRLLALADTSHRRANLEAWLARQPQPLALPLARLRHAGTSPSNQLHPWAAAAVALQGAEGQRAAQQLQRWRRQGCLSHTDLEHLAVAPPQAFPLLRQAPALPTGPSAAAIRLTVLGSHWHDWQAHAWLQHLPIPLQPRHTDLQPTPQPGQASLQASMALHLQPVRLSAEQGWLEPLAQLTAVFDPDPERVDLLRRLGIQAHLLNPAQAQGSGWLHRGDEAEQAAAQLGLPAPTSLQAADGELAILGLGPGGESWERQLQSPCWAWPGFDQLQILNPEQARLLAAWLNACNRQGLQLVRLQPQEREGHQRGFQALQPPASPHGQWQPPQAFTGTISPRELLSELRWRQQGCPAPEACSTPTPPSRCLWEQHRAPATAAVCISLHNYGHTIEAALNSVRLQSHEALELVVVDDASNDGGERRVLRWLEQHGHRFARAQLLQHPCNGGLAAARNSAFQAAQAPWCFVLDADNTLLPHAVACCLTVAHTAPASTAVVHPLVERIDTAATGADPRALISGVSWQQAQFLRGNVVDAMALVRRSAWEQVGGYSHIPGGWEDFDFWCQLIDAGLHGVLCPQRLAIYHCHANSMLATDTNRQLRRLSRLLQARHPWLHLAAPEPSPDGWPEQLA